MYYHFYVGSCWTYASIHSKTDPPSKTSASCILIFLIFFSYFFLFFFFWSHPLWETPFALECLIGFAPSFIQAGSASKFSLTLTTTWPHAAAKQQASITGKNQGRNMQIYGVVFQDSDSIQKPMNLYLTKIFSLTWSLKKTKVSFMLLVASCC